MTSFPRQSRDTGAVRPPRGSDAARHGPEAPEPNTLPRIADGLG